MTYELRTTHNPLGLVAIVFLCSILGVNLNVSTVAQEKISVLIVDGQNNHGNWPQTTEMMKSYLVESGRFTVEIARTKPSGVDADFRPEFQKYDVVLSNYNGTDWPKATQDAFVEYMQNGGGFVVIHAANNAFPNWTEYNKIIGLGGWGGRNEKHGPYWYFDADKLIKDTRPGGAGSHGRQHPYRMTMRDEHPITKDMPKTWMHANDELYDRMRGSGTNMKVLATAFADPATGGSGNHEPIVIALEYGKGRVFHNMMGHGNDSQQCVGFITLLLRGAEWAGTGEVTVEIPDDFPTDEKVSVREFQFEDR
ncbi:MAG TPA: ThuA domain-containing protein [Pirellulaceae bacterium]|nr:ThuA domain-containing protein [Pirellulaceae bacterium]HMO91379.1 ThuA domain-containing protein [Pirellulaceae bacterium]HMP69604.1 ThuA domain-containing protein [Pirellulaceae bacterium]